MTASRLAAVVGWLCLSTSIVLLSSPVAVAVLAADGRLPPALEDAAGWARLASGVLGLALVAASRSRRLEALSLPVRVGDVVVLAASAVVVLGLAEGWLRFRAARDWGSATRMPPTLDQMMRDGALPLRPGRFAYRGVSDFDPAYDRVLFVNVNRYGLRGEAPVMPKARGTRRVVALGGSTTFGYSVADDEAWPSRLARALGPGYDVLNAGRPGATTYRNFAYLRDHLLRLDPDVLILNEGFNDMWRAVRRHAGDQADYGIVDEGLPPTPGALDQGDPLPWAWRVSLLGDRGARWVGYRLGAWRPSWSEPPAGGGPFEFNPAIVSIYEKNLAAMVRLGRAHGVQPVLATFAACDDSALPPAELERRMSYVTREIPQLDVATALRAMEQYRDITRRVARAEGVPLVDLALRLPKDLRYFTDTVHFTPEGERAVAEALAEELRSSRIAPPVR